MKEQNGNEFMGELIETVDVDKAEKLALMSTMPQAQKDAVEKAEGFGWAVLDIDVVSKKHAVTLSSNGKKMRIDVNGKRIKEVRI